jgi:hypothetical protein
MIFALFTACVNTASDTTLSLAYDSLIALPQNRHCVTPYNSVSPQDGHFMVAVIGCDRKISFGCKFLPICEQPSNVALERLAHATHQRSPLMASALQARVSCVFSIKSLPISNDILCIGLNLELGLSLLPL